MKYHEENIEEYNRIPGAIRISNDETVNIEHLIYKIAMVQQIILLKSRIEILVDHDSDLNEPLDDWASSGMYDCLREVVHALKCGLYGYEEARKH